MLLGPRTGPVTSGESSLASPVLWSQNLRLLPPAVSSQVLRPLKPSGVPSPKAPSTRRIRFPCFLGLYLLRAERLGPVVQNQALLGPMGGAGRLGRVGGLCRLGRIALQRRDGPPAAVGGGQVVGGRHDSPKSKGGKKEVPAAVALSRLASHGLAEPAHLLCSLPPHSVNVITHWSSGGGGEGIPGAPSLLLLALPWPMPDEPPVLSVRLRGAMGKWAMPPK